MILIAKLFCPSGNDCIHIIDVFEEHKMNGSKVGVISETSQPRAPSVLLLSLRLMNEGFFIVL
jgi:hypothetical protein